MAGVTDPYPEAGITSIFPNDDINLLLDPSFKGDPAMVIIKMPEQNDGRKGICILEPSFPEEVTRWKETKRGARPKEYLEYKRQRTHAINSHLLRVFPAYRERLEIVDSATMLTFKEYLNNADGSAYGVKQKMGQYNLIGKLPLHNLFAAGQSALLPGIIGAMMSSLIVGRAVVGKGQFGKLLNQELCH
jgi:phytoene dehydrogenase-like protein